MYSNALSGAGWYFHVIVLMLWATCRSLHWNNGFHFAVFINSLICFELANVDFFWKLIWLSCTRILNVCSSAFCMLPKCVELCINDCWHSMRSVCFLVFKVYHVWRSWRLFEVLTYAQLVLGTLYMVLLCLSCSFLGQSLQMNKSSLQSGHWLSLDSHEYSVVT